MDEQLRAMESAAVNAGSELADARTLAAEKDQEIARLTAETERLEAENESLRAQLDRTYGKTIEQYATTNEEKVRLRAQPDVDSRRIRELKQGTTVFILKEVVNSRYESWAYLDVNGQNGYIMMKYLDLGRGN